MKDVVRFITEEEAYRFKPNNSIESDIFRRVKYIIDNQEFAGNFYSSSYYSYLYFSSNSFYFSSSSYYYFFYNSF